MFFFEKFFSLYTFALGWGLLVTFDFVMRLSGYAGTYGIQEGVIFPYIAPIMGSLVIFAFLYFLTTPNAALSKKFYSSCNYLMLMTLTASLIIDFVLRFVAFDVTYCRGMDAEAFAACKDESMSAVWLDLVKIACAIRLMFYSVQVLEQYTDQVEKAEDDFDNQKTLL